MKFGTFMMSLVGLGFSLTASASTTALKCEKDTRPVDGPYTAIEIVEDENEKYDIFYEVITAGFGAPVQHTRVEIAKNISRAVFSDEDPRLGVGHKSSSEEGEKTNSGFKSSLVERTGVTSSGELETVSKIEIEVYSPQLREGAQEKGFPYMERAGRVTFTFGAGQGQAFLTGGCTVK